MTTIPDRQTILWRRHLCVSVIRVGAAGWLVWIVISQLRGQFLAGHLSGSLTSFIDVFFLGLLFQLPVLVFALTALVFQHRIARWIIPDGFRVDVCPTCGYSLKNLKSPICPECGGAFGGAAAGGRQPSRA